MSNALASGDAPPVTCELCVALAANGVTDQPRDARVPRADELAVFAVGEGHGDRTQLRRCPHCGTWYQYRYHYEYDVTGSWDEFYLWRLPDTARPLDRVLGDDTPDAERVASHAALLTAASDTVRAAAALAAWVVVGNGHPLPVTSVVWALIDDKAGGGNHAYRALLAYLRRGLQESVAVLAAFDATDVPTRDKRFSKILRREAQGIIDAAAPSEA